MNLVNYKKKEAKEIIRNRLKWLDYGGKHYESIFTRWYQGVYLPYKFSIDKRKAHLSNLILNEEIKLSIESIKKKKKGGYNKGKK